MKGVGYEEKAYLMVLALCAALAITACGTSTDQKDDKNLQQKRRIQQIKKIPDLQIPKSQKKRIPIKTAKRQPPEIQACFRG